MLFILILGLRVALVFAFASLMNRSKTTPSAPLPLWPTCAAPPLLFFVVVLVRLTSGAVSCSKALPIVRKAQASKAAARARLKSTPQKRRASFSAQRESSRTPGKRDDHRRAGTGGTSATAKRQRRPAAAAAAAAAAIATEATADGGVRWLGGDSVRRRRGGRRLSRGGGIRGVMEGHADSSDDDEEEEEEEEEMVFSEQSSEGSGWESSETGKRTEEGRLGGKKCSAGTELQADCRPGPQKYFRHTITHITGVVSSFDLTRSTNRFEYSHFTPIILSGRAKRKHRVCVVRVQNPPPTPQTPRDRSGDSVDDDDDDDSSSDDSQEEETKPPKRQPLTPKGKKRAGATATKSGPWSETPVSARRNGGGAGSGRGDDNGDGENSPWESMAGLSLCQFWRYRLLLEVVLAARGGGQAGGREEFGRAPEPRLAEVRASTTARWDGGSGGRPGYTLCRPHERATLMHGSLGTL